MRGYHCGVIKMFYYQFHIGDFIKDAAHLELAEEAIYRRLLDLYYTTEKPISNNIESVAREIRAKGHEKTVELILNEFFKPSKNGWKNKRADDEIKKYKGFSIAGKIGAEKRWRKDSPPIDSPIAPPMQTNNRKPITVNHINNKPMSVSAKKRKAELMDYIYGKKEV